MAQIVQLTNYKKKKPPTPPMKVGVNYLCVKFVEAVSDKQTKLHFLDGSTLLIKRSLSDTYAKMKKMLKECHNTK